MSIPQLGWPTRTIRGSWLIPRYCSLIFEADEVFYEFCKKGSTISTRIGMQKCERIRRKTRRIRQDPLFFHLDTWDFWLGSRRFLAVPFRIESVPLDFRWAEKYSNETFLCTRILCRNAAAMFRQFSLQVQAGMTLEPVGINWKKWRSLMIPNGAETENSVLGELTIIIWCSSLIFRY